MLDACEKDHLLKDWTTFGIGGKADYLAEVHDISTMQAFLSFCFEKKIPYIIVGKGSNILFSDKGFRGLVLINKIEFLKRPEPSVWHVGAGNSFSLLGTQSAREGFSGLEFASGIPASVGGAVFMNAGANGGEAWDHLTSIDYVQADGTLVCFKKEELSYSYRFSSFQEMKGAIVGATFKLSTSSEAREKQLNIIGYRKKTQPYGKKSAGCVFRNPEQISAGALIEKSGLKGYAIGSAEVSSLHANFLVNAGGASCSEILQLINHVKQTVKNKTGYDLENEVRIISENGEPLESTSI